MRVVGRAACLVLLALVVGCGGDDEAGAGGSGGEPLVIGDVSSFTGPCGAYGAADAVGYDIAVEAINSRGGLLGRTPIKMIHEDTESNPEVAVQKARKLLDQDKVDLVVGLECSNLRDAVLPEIEKRDKVLLYPSDYEGEVYSDNMYVLGATPSQEERADALKTLVERAGGKRMYILGADYVGPRAINEYIKEAAVPEAGVEVVGEEYIPLTQTDFASTLKRIKDADPDIIYNNLVGDHTVAFQQQAANEGIRPLAADDKPGAEGRVVMIGHAYFGNSIKAMGETAEGAYRVLQWTAGLDTPGSQKFLKAWNAEPRKVEPNYIAEGSYSSMLALEAAAKKANSTEPEKLTAALDDLEFEAASGDAKIRASDHHTELNMYLFQVQDGKFKRLQNFGRVPPAYNQKEKRYTG